MKTRLSKLRPRVRPRALLAQLLLALTLLVAQSAAQAHIYSHFNTSTAKSDFNGTAGQLCGECLSSAPLLGAAGVPDSPRIVLVAAAVVAIACVDAPCVEPSHEYAFRSRAPPELL